jgi:hypothetical protein
MSYKVEVLAIGESTWTSNGLRFAKWTEANASGCELLGRWFGAKDFRVVESPDPVNYKFDFEAYRNVRLESVS